MRAAAPRFAEPDRRIHECDAAHAVTVFASVRERDAAAHRVGDDEESRQFGRSDEFLEVADEVVGRVVTPGIPVALPMATKIQGENVKFTGERTTDMEPRTTR